MCDIRPADMSVQQVAALAKLSLSETEAAQMQADMDDMLAFARALQAVDTDGVPPTNHILPVENVLREDVPAPSMPQEKLLRNAPAWADGCVSVPKTFD